MTASARETRIVQATLWLGALLLVFKYFPGIENTSYYAGFVINAIHPDLMTQDPIVGTALSATGSPYKFTIYYLLPKLFGELWLDDRLIAVFYTATVIAALLAIDRIGTALGATGAWERMAILLMFLKDHRLLENEVNIAHSPDFHHSAVALPIGLWLLYAAIRGRGLVVVLALSVLLTAVSLQVAPSTIGMALLAVAAIGNDRQRRVARTMLGLGAVAAIFVLTFYVTVPQADRAAMWQLLLYDWYEGMVLPFDARFSGPLLTVMGNAGFALLCAAVLFLPARKTAPLTAVRCIVTAAVVLWLVMGLYVQMAPAGWQFPQLLLFPVSRQLQYVQVVAYVAAMVLLFRWADASATPARLAVVAGAYALLVVAGPGNHVLWAVLFAAALVASALLVWVGERRGILGLSNAGNPANPMGRYKAVLASALAITMITALGTAAVERLPDWIHLARTGVHGFSESAIWQEPSEYLREQSPPDAVLLPMRYPMERALLPGEAPNARLIVTRNAASRSGRAVPAPMMLSHGLDLQQFRKAQDQRKILGEIPEAWMAGDAAGVLRGIDNLTPSPNYIAVPEAEAHRVDGPEFPFVEQARVGGFAILRRSDKPVAGEAR